MLDDLQRVLDGRWADQRDRMREVVLSDPYFEPPVGLDMTAHRAWVLERLMKLASEPGGTSVGFPENVGGEGDTGGFVTGFEMLAMGDLSLLVKIGVQFGLFGGAIQQLGNEQHRQDYLPGVIDGTILGCFGMTETGHGSNVQQLGTTITYDADGDVLVVHTPDRASEKDYIGNAADDGQYAVVFGQLVTADGGHGVHAVIVPIRDRASGDALPGVTITDDGPKAGLPGVDNGRLKFDEVRVPRTNLLDRFGSIDADGLYTSPIESEGRRFFTTIGTLVQGRVSIAGSAVSATKVAESIAIRYAETRRQFGPPDAEDEEVLLLDYRAHQRLLLPRLARTYALHAAQLETVELLDSVMTGETPGDVERRELESRAAVMKALCTWHASDTIQACREACGGAGYLAINRLSQLRADTDVFTTFEGANTVLLQLVAKGLLTGYREEFGSLDMMGTVRFVADLAADRVVEFTAARAIVQSLIDALPGRDGDDDLTERGTHLKLFRWREEHLLETVATRLRKGADKDLDLFEVFNACQDHVLLAAQAHGERLVLESFVAMIDGSSTPVRDVLEQVCDLYALDVLERERAYFMEHNALSAARAKTLTKLVNDRCRELRPHARLLVDAYGIPEQQLQAPLAQGLAGSGP